MKHLFLFILMFLHVLWVHADINQPLEAQPSSRLSNGHWNAQWITCPGVSPYEYGVYHFRKSLTLDQQPDSFIINISADNRYRLFVNGQAVCWGPARGVIFHWYYETIDIASFLNSGENIIAVQVWNMGEWTPGAQQTLKTGLIIQGNTPKEEGINTNSSWKVYQNKSYSPSLDHRQDVGCSDIVKANAYPWGWQTATYKDDGWVAARPLGNGQPYGCGTGYDWVLCPRDIPLMEESLLRMKNIRRMQGMEGGKNLLTGNAPLQIPPHKTVSLLIDQGFLTTAYPELLISGGKDASVKLTYCEALMKEWQKAHRDSIDNRQVIGMADIFYPDGGEERLFRPLWFRTYRYIQLDITTQDAPLIIKDLYGKYTGYPFKENGYFACDNPLLKDIWTVGWRTARLCAHETYFDCPYYEQLQYVGDTRIQALISLYVDGDDRLMRKAIKMFDYSRSYEGITTSRYPARTPQYIPPFSLYWINIIHDYWMHRDDPEFIKSCLPGIKTVLAWFEEKVDSQTGMLGHLPHWNFIDWPKEWPWNNEKPLGGAPPEVIEGGSSILTLQLAYTLKDAVDLFWAFGDTYHAKKYEDLYRVLCKSTLQSCWDNEKFLLGNTKQLNSFSQHANIMGILSDAIPVEKQQAVFEKLNTDPSLIQATFYYRFYLFRALKKVGLAERYVSMLTPWEDMLNIGLTTFAENPEPTRSDCHAWSASPVYDFLATVCGVEPEEPGFKSVKIEPHLVELKQIKGAVPHPKGMIEIELRKKNAQLTGVVSLPEGLTGHFNYQEKRLVLHPGKNEIKTR